MTLSQLKKVIISLTIVLATAVAIYLLIINKQNIFDEIKLYHYQPPAQIAAIATEDGMTSYTRKVFYVNHPEIDPKTTFAANCPDTSEQFVVLGCYHINQRGIYVLSVNNPDLSGIEQVTAAYETLHAIYQRLSPKAQAQLNEELTAFQNHGLDDPIVESQIAGFTKSEPGAVLNEMTSLFGTEVQNLPASLTQFYAKYFNNRQVLLNYYDAYETAFTSRQQQVTAYDSQLNSLQIQITADQSQLKTEYASLLSDQTILNNLKSTNQIPLYNSGISSYNQLVDSYNNLVASSRSLVDQYNQIVAQRNSLVLEEQQLTKAITSNNQQISN